MPRFEPFAGLRYDPTRVDLSAVVCPPYDVIGPEARARLVARHSANAVRVELPEPDHRLGLDRYDSAANRLLNWQDEGILVQDRHPAFYTYRMTTADGRTTTGLVGALGVDEHSASEVFAHEQTIPTARTDRLRLLSATRANLSPIWGLSLSSGFSALLTPDGPAAGEAVDDDATRHQLWLVTDDAAVAAVQAAVTASPVVLADGHHRYATARAYHQERSGDPGSETVMALVVELTPEQLAVGAIHRALAGLPEGLDMLDVCSSWFDLTRVGDFDERSAGALGQSGAFALLMPSGAWLLSPKDGTAEAAGSDLDSAMVAMVVAELPEHELEYLNSWQDGFRAVVDGSAQAVFLLRPVSVDRIAEWARAGRQMPPKSTYFYPKPATGMVFRTLDLAPGLGPDAGSP